MALPLSKALMRKAAAAAMAHRQWSERLTVAFEERYGKTYSDIDCDQLIDLFDYGLGGRAIPGLVECDKLMGTRK